MKNVWVIEWEEWEEGWGPRPDGVSLHTSEEKRKEYPKIEQKRDSEFHSSFPTRTYEREVSDQVYDEIVGNGGSKRYFIKPW